MCSREQKVVIDDDFHQIFKPFYYILYIYCMHTFNIKKNYATPVSKLNFVIAAIVNILIMWLFYETIQHLSFWDKTASKISYITYFQYLKCFMLLTFLHFYQNKTNFKLIVKLQELCQRFRDPEETKRLKMMSWLWCGVVMMYYVFLVTLKLTRDQYWHWTRAVFLATTIVFEIKLTNMAVILYFLLFKLRKWRKFLRNHINEDSIDKNILDDFKCSFQEIISIYLLFKKAFQTIALLHFVMTFLQCLVYIEIVIVSEKTAPDDPDIVLNHVIGVFSWIIKGIVIESNFCIVCELFYSEVEHTRDEMVQKIGSKLSGLEETNRNMELYRLSKCVRRVLDNNFTKMTACGLFNIDIALPLRMSSVVATYTLVLLQFAQ